MQKMTPKPKHGFTRQRLRASKQENKEVTSIILSPLTVTDTCLITPTRCLQTCLAPNPIEWPFGVHNDHFALQGNFFSVTTTGKTLARRARVLKRHYLILNCNSLLPRHKTTRAPNSACCPRTFSSRAVHGRPR